MANELRFATVQADALAHEAGVRVQRRFGRGRSTRFAWYEEDECLTLVVGAREKGETDLALAAGLAARDGRKLTLVLPQGWHEPTVRRWAWLGESALWRVLLHNGEEVTAAAPRPGWRDVLDPALESPLRDAAVLDVHASQLVSTLTKWLDDEGSLEPSHRPGALRWKYRGQRVLEICPRGRGVRITAGIHWGENSPRSSPEPIDRDEPLSPEDLSRIQRLVVEGKQLRDGRSALPLDEHWLQATLADRPALLGLAPDIQRELPALRPLGSAALRRQPGGVRGSQAFALGFVDLAGLGADGSLVLVETKLGHDPMFVLQGLDYRIWAEANRAHLAERFGCSPDVPISVTYCVSNHVQADGGIARRSFDEGYLRAHLEALDERVDWRLVAVKDWVDGPADITVLGRHRDRVGELVAARRSDEAEEEGIQRRGARLAAIAEAHLAWAQEVEEGQSSFGGVVDTTGLADAGEHWADATASADEQARFLEIVRERVSSLPRSEERLRDTLLSQSGSASLHAYVEASGDVVLAGQELNPPAVLSDDGEYEWWVTVRAVDVPRLVAALGGSPNDDVLHLLTQHGDEIAKVHERVWLRERGVPAEFCSYP